MRHCRVRVGDKEGQAVFRPRRTSARRTASLALQRFNSCEPDHEPNAQDWGVEACEL